MQELLRLVGPDYCSSRNPGHSFFCPFQFNLVSQSINAACFGSKSFPLSGHKKTQILDWMEGNSQPDTLGVQG